MNRFRLWVFAGESGNDFENLVIEGSGAGLLFEGRAGYGRRFQRGWNFWSSNFVKNKKFS
jgi:hypothetical protein